MAIVKQYESYFGKIYHKVQVKCSARTGKFSIELPVEAHIPIGKTVGGMTLKEVQTEYRNASNRFNEESCVTTKIIVVKYDNNDGGFLSDGISIGFACGVFEKHKWPGISENVKYTPEDSSLPDEVDFHSKLWPGDIGDNCVELLWTAEYEAFLAQLGKAFLILAKRMDEFTASKKSLLEFIKNQKLLPGLEKE